MLAFNIPLKPTRINRRMSEFLSIIVRRKLQQSWEFNYKNIGTRHIFCVRPNGFPSQTGKDSQIEIQTKSQNLG
jgi:hypothetical protein